MVASWGDGSYGRDGSYEIDRMKRGKDFYRIDRIKRKK
jgi:hypothetical protein